MFLKIMMLGIVTQLCIHTHAGDFPLERVVVADDSSDSTSSDSSQDEKPKRNPAPSPRQKVLNIDVTQEAQENHDPLTTQNCLNAQFNINLGGFVGMLAGTAAGGIAVSLTNVALAPLYGACVGTVAVPLILYTIGGIRYYYKKIYDEEKK